jgi:hypothetical protein
MFPIAFADRVVARFSSPGDTILDPFAGRGTAVFSAAHQGRHGIGIEINPVGWVYGKTKIGPATRSRVEKRLNEIGEASSTCEEAARSLPVFFKWCFSAPVRRFLVAARDELSWRTSRVDRTTAALLLVYLHGKRGAALSNQMRQTKSMAPDYALEWWRARKMTPLKIDPVDFMVRRLDWRYAKGLPVTERSQMYLANSVDLLPRLERVGLHSRRQRTKLLFTSPPYFATTNYHYDQWLRLWLLGGPSNAHREAGATELRGKFENRESYRNLLQSVFEKAADLLSTRAVVYVRTGQAEGTYEVTRKVLGDVFPSKRLRKVPRPYSRPTQTRLFGHPANRHEGEVDLILYPR